MNRLLFLLSHTPSFVSSEQCHFSGGSGGAPTISTDPFATPAFDRAINLVVLVLAIGTPFLPFLGR